MHACECGGCGCNEKKVRRDVKQEKAADSERGEKIRDQGVRQRAASDVGFDDRRFDVVDER